MSLRRIPTRIFFSTFALLRNSSSLRERNEHTTNSGVNGCPIWRPLDSLITFEILFTSVYSYMKIDECRMLRAFKQCRKWDFSSCPGLLRSNRQRLTWLEMFTLRRLPRGVLITRKCLSRRKHWPQKNQKQLTKSNAISQWFKEHDWWWWHFK